MPTTTLRKVGGSVMLALPPAIRDLLNLKAGATVGVSVEDGKLVIAPASKPRYTLGDLLAQCDAQSESSEEDRAWLGDEPQGSELL
ncbi:AbrB/MazE/SpoVT family DNA-binding domain-containing protein [Methylocystis iwaonis]|uniref:AbrB/MazE/SpoVT family DNA-binding domain-containing protein n=1 Tax=Methylocystis iwaonis TaxID=2885079 RepID=UPI002E7C0D01|nr:AbrB/MazE/SpoVT family DNA-binding domain-containing protein [Methylocystis iwaonis]